MQRHTFDHAASFSFSHSCTASINQSLGWGGKSLQHVKGHGLKGLDVGGFQEDKRSAPSLCCLLPPPRTKAPFVSSFESRERGGMGGREIVPSRSREIQKLICHHSANRVDTKVHCICVAETVTVPSCLVRFHTAGLQGPPQNISRHVPISLRGVSVHHREETQSSASDSDGCLGALKEQMALQACEAARRERRHVEETVSHQKQRQATNHRKLPN
mmetsp:Transcript_17416/g.35380  ORF Transcript_17416/g.35380 Transcript_17416/m.35380 type:complete len:216 (+) Transcript_17416:311-958(+)